MNRTILSTTGLLMALVLFFAVNMVSLTSLKSARFDFTDNRVYTLSAGTKNILGQLDEPITLRFYFSKTLATSLPSIKNYAQRVEELLAEFSLHAHGKLKLEVIEPEAFSDDEDRAVGYGLQGVALDASNTKFYFGLVGVNSVDEEGVIPFFQTNRQNFLEYDLTRLIYSLSGQKKKVIGLLSTLPINQGGQESWVVMEQISQQFEVRTLQPTLTSIDKAIDVLLLVHPQGLSDEALFAIDQFVLGGGNALVFVDPYAESQTAENPQDPMAALTMKRNSELSKLLDAWGVEMTVGKVVGDAVNAHEVRFAAQPGQSAVVNYVVWLNLGQEALATDDVITAELETLNLATAGALQQKAGATTTLIPLLKSSEQTMLIDATQLAFMQDPTALLKNFKSENQVRTLAARITGKVKTAFPEGKPKAAAAEAANAAKPDESSPPPLAESKNPISVIVVADTDLLQDKFWVQVQNFFGQRVAIPSANNGTLVVNALDNLTGSQDLISVRSRGSFSRPFDRVKAIKREAEQEYRATEQALSQRLEQTEARLNELQKGKTGNTSILSDAQKQEILQFREEQVKVRKQLRDVQHQLSKNIDRLETQVKVINIIFIPMLVAIFGFYHLLRLRGQRKRTVIANGASA